MAIQPGYAQAILSGAKTVEFRKRALAPDVETVLIYETAPTQRIVGLFRIVDTVRLSPRGLWRRFAEVGSITRPEFMDYYASRSTGVALVLGSVVSFEEPIPLSELRPRPAVPQSVSYISAEAVHQIELKLRSHDADRGELLPA
ncbi:MAG: ASCH domain-containing protein [Nocardioides sp.]|nr:ASCH domain-containing protein [Nocardioides sp.]